MAFSTMSLSTASINMQTTEKWNINAPESKNVSKKRFLESSDDENYSNLNVKKAKTNSDNYAIKWNKMLVLMDKLNKTPEDRSISSSNRDPLASFRCVKCCLWLQHCSGCNQFKCFNCEVKCVTTEELVDHDHSYETATSKASSTTNKVPKIFTCLCNFTANKKKDMKCHKLFDCKISTRETRDENKYKCKKIKNKINKLLGVTPIKSNSQPTVNNEKSLDERKKNITRKIQKLFGGTPMKPNSQATIYKDKALDKEKKTTSCKIQRLFGETPIKPYTQASISKDKSLVNKKKNTSSKIHKLFGGTPVKSYTQAKIKETARRKIQKLFGGNPIKSN